MVFEKTFSKYFVSTYLFHNILFLNYLIFEDKTYETYNFSEENSLQNDLIFISYINQNYRYIKRNMKIFEVFRGLLEYF